MDIQLRLLFPWPPMGDVIYCMENLQFVPDNRIFRQLRDLRELGCEDGYDSQTIETHYPHHTDRVKVCTDQGFKESPRRLGEDGIKYAWVHDLRRLYIPDDSHPKNKAIKAFLMVLPEDNNSIVLLDWGDGVIID